MSYDLHITRAESYMDEENPITLEEIERLIDPLPEGFTVDRTGAVTAVTPSGDALTARCGAYLIYEEKNKPESRTHIYFNDPHGPYFTVSNECSLPPVIALAEAIGARVQGDEGEIYTRDGIVSEVAHEPESPKKAGILHRFFHRKR